MQKRIAPAHSKLVENYFSSLTKKSPEKPNVSRLTKRLTGIIPPKQQRKYSKDLLEKRIGFYEPDRNCLHWCIKSRQRFSYPR